MGSEEYKEYDAKYFLEFQGLNFSAHYRDIPVVADKYGEDSMTTLGCFIG